MASGSEVESTYEEELETAEEAGLNQGTLKVEVLGFRVVVVLYVLFGLPKSCVSEWGSPSFQAY